LAEEEFHGKLKYSEDILKPFEGILFFENIPSSLTSYKIVLA